MFDVPFMCSMERNKFRRQAFVRCRTVKLTRGGRGGCSDPTLHSVALLVFFSAAAGAWIVAADLFVAPLNCLGCDWFFSAIEDEWGEGA